MVQTAEAKPGTAQLHLGSLPAINHEKLLTDIDYLRSRQMAHRRQSRTASQYMYVKSFHTGKDIYFYTAMKISRKKYHAGKVKIYSEETEFLTI